MEIDLTQLINTWQEALSKRLERIRPFKSIPYCQRVLISLLFSPFALCPSREFSATLIKLGLAGMGPFYA